MNQTQTFRYRSIKQNKAFCTGPLSKTIKMVKKLFSYHFDMHLFRSKTFFCRPNSQTQTFRYRSIKQNKAFCTGPLSKTKKIVKKLFSYHFYMHLFRAKTFLFRPSSRTQTFRYRSIKQNKRFCYRLSKQNKTTLRTMIFIFLESTDPSTGNLCFFRFGTMSFKLSQPAVPYSDSCLASKT